MNHLRNLIPHKSIPVLLYHRVADLTLEEDPLRLGISPQKFERQMKFLYKNRFKVVSLEEASRQLQKGETLYPKQIAITFDDGYEDNYANAFPILQKYKFPATIFLVTEFLGKTCSWEGSWPLPLMNWNQIREMAKYWISFQSHTCTHPDLLSLNDERILQEFIKSKENIQDILNCPVKYLAYPYGRFDSRIIQIAERAGYQGGCAAGMVPQEGKFSLERLQLTAKDGKLTFLLKTSGLAGWVRRLRHLRT